MTKIKHKQYIKYGKHSIILETGYIAKQADASVLANMEDTIVLATIVINKEKISISPILSLNVNYQEKLYAAGKIPNSFYRREGRLTENEILKSRLIDRCIRPLFKVFFNEIQINVTVLSINPLIDTTLISIIAVSSALSITNIPLNGIIGVAQLGYINNKLILNPSIKQLNISNLKLLVCGTHKAVIMVDAEANLLSDKLILKAIIYGHKLQQILIDNIYKFSNIVKKKKSNFLLINTIINEKIKELFIIINKFYKFFKKYCLISDKIKRLEKINLLTNKIYLTLNKLNIDYEKDYVDFIIYKLCKYIIRNNIIKNLRIDNRDYNNIRPINIRLNILPRTHGSVLFTRGETQALVVTTLGTIKQGQFIDELYGEFTNNFIFHYNFPSYSVGEIGNLSIPKRREIGHANLAKKGLLPIMPKIDKFPYTIRIVSEITESNGSSSMASVCGASLSLMLAGVPLNHHIAGIAMGLIKKNKKYIILTDIIGDEDKYGDIDFKLIGSYNKISAIQMDIKICDINYKIIQELLYQANIGIKHIINKMNNKIIKSKTNISTLAPKIKKIKINPLKIGNLIGKNGIIIKSITEDTSSNIEIQNNGIVTITALKIEQIKASVRRIIIAISNIIIGNVYLTIIKRINNLNLWISFNTNDKYLHKVKINNKNYLNNKTLTLGQKIYLKVLNIDFLGFIYVIILNNKK